MNRQMSETRLRRDLLLARIAAQREEVADLGARWQAPLALADQGLAAVHFLRSHPVLIAGAAALRVVRRRGVMGLMKGGWKLWKGYRLLAALTGRASEEG